MSMIKDLLPQAVKSAEAFTDPPGITLFASEEALMVRAVSKRRNEFTTVRFCARQALAQLGIAATPLLPGERGAPLWPDGIVGSMTHCAGYRAAAVAEAATIRSIGIDAEPHLALPEGVLEAVSLPDEREHLAQLRAASGTICWDRLLFSAKESVYKTWFPLTRRWLGFEQARLRFEPSGTFTAELLIDGTTVDADVLTGFGGRWLVRDGLLLTGIVLPAQAG
jgi:4'-phosphopantetheinyl transferase EntD